MSSGVRKPSGDLPIPAPAPEPAAPAKKTLYEKHDELVATAEKAEQDLADLKKEQSLALKVAGKTKNARAIELAKKWDLQGNGSVSRVDFRTNVRNLGLKAEDAEIDALFARMDDDGSGSMDLGELRTALQKLQDEAEKAADVTGKVATVATRLRKKATFSEHACGLMREFDVAEQELQQLRDTQPLHFKLGDAIEGLNSNELAQRWRKDTDIKADINKMQFRQRVRDLVPEANFKECDHLFATLDSDGSGVLEPGELKTALAKLQKSECLPCDGRGASGNLGVEQRPEEGETREVEGGGGRWREEGGVRVGCAWNERWDTGRLRTDGL